MHVVCDVTTGRATRPPLLLRTVDYLTEGQSEPVQVLAFDCLW